MTECIACGNGVDSAETLQALLDNECPECGTEEFEDRCSECGYERIED